MGNLQVTYDLQAIFRLKFTGSRLVCCSRSLLSQMTQLLLLFIKRMIIVVVQQEVFEVVLL